MSIFAIFSVYAYFLNLDNFHSSWTVITIVCFQALPSSKRCAKLAGTFILTYKSFLNAEAQQSVHVQNYVV